MRLQAIAQVSKRLGISPNVGMPNQTVQFGSGKWEESGGDQSKFGLSSSELPTALDFLERHKMKGVP